MTKRDISEPWRKPLIRVRAQEECTDILAEALATGDLDLLEEMAAKMTDVIVVYRRKGKPALPRWGMTFSPEQIDSMAFDHAMAAAFELPEEEE